MRKTGSKDRRAEMDKEFDEMVRLRIERMQESPTFAALRASRKECRLLSGQAQRLRRRQGKPVSLERLARLYRHQLAETRLLEQALREVQK